MCHSQVQNAYTYVYGTTIVVAHTYVGGKKPRLTHLKQIPSKTFLNLWTRNATEVIITQQQKQQRVNTLDLVRSNE